MTDPEPQILPEEQAKAILRQAIEERLGKNWDAPNSGWHVVSNHAYMARLNKGRTNVDFYVHYVTGEVTVEVKEVGDGQDVGRLIGWSLLGLTAVIVLILARGMGWI